MVGDRHLGSRGIIDGASEVQGSLGNAEFDVLQVKCEKGRSEWKVWGEIVVCGVGNLMRG